MSIQLELHGVENVMGKLKGVGIHTIRRAFEASQITAMNLEDHSQNVAPWHDRTTIARTSIYAYATFTPTDIIIYHGIQVHYGVYLELSNGGKYRVIAPSINKYRTIWQRNLSDILSL